jgi:hypothetical protein
VRPFSPLPYGVYQMILKTVLNAVLLCSILLLGMFALMQAYLIGLLTEQNVFIDAYVTNVFAFCCTVALLYMCISLAYIVNKKQGAMQYN